MNADRSVIEEFVYRSCMLLDEGDFPGFMELCAPEFRYRLTAWSPEIKKEMTWLDRDRAEMEGFFNMLHLHNSDHSPLTRNATVYRVEVEEGNQRANVVSALQIYKTALDGGATQLLAVGKYNDTIAFANGQPRLLSRTVRLATRDLGRGYHIPF